MQVRENIWSENQEARMSAKLTWEKTLQALDGGFMGRDYGEIRTEETRSLIPGMKLRLDYVKMEETGRPGYRTGENRRGNAVSCSLLPLPKDDERDKVKDVKIIPGNCPPQIMLKIT